MSRTILKNLAVALALVSVTAGCSGDKNKETKTAASVTASSSQASDLSTGTGSSAAVRNTNQAAAAPAQESYVPAPKVERIVYNFSKVDGTANDVEMAIRAADNGNIDTAVSMLQRISDTKPDAFLAHYNLGVMYERQLKTVAARRAYELSLQAEPKFTPALIQLVRLDIRDGNPTAGISKANTYITSNPDVFEHNYAKLEGMIAAKQYDEAIALISALLKRDEANGKLRYYLAMTEFSRGRYRLAEFIVGEALEIIPDDADALFLRARIHEALSEEDVGLIPGIAATLDRVIELNPDHLEALWMRGVIYYEASNYTKAEEYFKHIIELNPSTVGAYINLANTYKTVDRGPEAETLLMKAKELDPNDGLVDFALGTLYLNTELIKLPGMNDMDRLRLARTQFENAQKHWKSKDDIALARGYIKTTDDAIETLQAMLDAEALFGGSSDEEPSDEATEEESE
ncbi:MAG: tetratricopeptide repeat protein [Proteobacteria bacterium]|nr:tetratricopeptide repeat protein [Pseudomonadota bacterium]